MMTCCNQLLHIGRKCNQGLLSYLEAGTLGRQCKHWLLGPTHHVAITGMITTVALCKCNNKLSKDSLFIPLLKPLKGSMGIKPQKS